MSIILGIDKITSGINNSLAREWLSITIAIVTAFDLKLTLNKYIYEISSWVLFYKPFYSRN